MACFEVKKLWKWRFSRIMILPEMALPFFYFCNFSGQLESPDVGEFWCLSVVFHEFFDRRVWTVHIWKTILNRLFLSEERFCAFWRLEIDLRAWQPGEIWVKFLRCWCLLYAYVRKNFSHVSHNSHNSHRNGRNRHFRANHATGATGRNSCEKSPYTHNPEVGSSSLPSATRKSSRFRKKSGIFLCFALKKSGNFFGTFPVSVKDAYVMLIFQNREKLWCLSIFWMPLTGVKRLRKPPKPLNPKMEILPDGFVSFHEFSPDFLWKFVKSYSASFSPSGGSLDPLFLWFFGEITKFPEIRPKNFVC